MEKLPKSHCNLQFKKTVARWDEAIPLGNGLSGALLWGPSNGFRVSLDRGDIWDTTPYEGIQSEEFTYPNMVRLAKAGDIKSIRRIFDAPYNQPLPSKLPAGKLVFDFGFEENVESLLELSTATARIKIGELSLSAFLHATKRYGLIQINCPLSAFTVSILNPEYSVSDGSNAQKESKGDSLNTDDLKVLTYPAPKIVSEESTRYFVQTIGNGLSYGIFLKMREVDGHSLLAFYVGTSLDGADWEDEALALLEQALDTGYAEALASHKAWWAAYWNKSSLSLPDPLFEKHWYLANYLLASCSRKGCYPMPLQGVWTADDGKLPPWKGDYHHDLNTQLCYYSYLKANHMEEGESFIDFLWDLADTARAFAKSFYKTDGLCLPSVMTIDGNPLGGWGMYSLSPTNQLWLCQAFERHYRFSGDKAFLKEKAYPYLSETAAMILGLLEERDGLLYLPISSSPEIHNDALESFLTPNSNYDLSLMQYLFTALENLALELSLPEEAEKWKGILKKLPTLAVNKRNVLMLSPDESLNESHRHLAHLMAIHPLRLIPYQGEANRKLIDASIHNLELLGTGLWVGYTFPWMAELFAIQGNGNGAAYQLRVFYENTCSQNGFHLNGDYKNRGVSQFHYRPFTLEGNFCAADALQEMLLHSENGYLKLFPAIPEEWSEQELSFTDFRAEKGLLVSASLLNGKLSTLELKPEMDCEITLIYPGLEQALSMKLNRGKIYTLSDVN